MTIKGITLTNMNKREMMEFGWIHSMNYELLRQTAVRQDWTDFPTWLEYTDYYNESQRLYNASPIDNAYNTV